LRLALEDADKLSDALTFRLAVETGAAEVLARQFAATREDRVEPGGQIRTVLAAKLADVNAACPDDYRRLDTLFHLSIAELAGSTLLSAACADARMRLNDLLNAIPVLQRNIDHTAGQHQAIVELGKIVKRQALILAFGDTFAIIGVVLAIAAIALLFARKTSAGGAAGAH